MFRRNNRSVFSSVSRNVRRAQAAILRANRNNAKWMKRYTERQREQQDRFARFRAAIRKAFSFVPMLRSGLSVVWATMTSLFVSMFATPPTRPIRVAVNRDGMLGSSRKRRRQRRKNARSKAKAETGNTYENLEPRQLLAVDLPVFPALGGVDNTGTAGSTIHSGGRTFVHDLTANQYAKALDQVDTLYYGLYSVEFGMDGSASPVSFTASDLTISGNTATWLRNDVPFKPTSSAPVQSVTGRMVIDFTDATDSSVLSGSSLPAGYDVPSGNTVHGRPHTEGGAVLAVRESDQDFNANVKFEVFSGGSWIPAKTFFDANTDSSMNGKLFTSFYGGYWQEKDPNLAGLAPTPDASADTWALSSNGIDAVVEINSSEEFRYPLSLMESISITGSADADKLIVDQTTPITELISFDGADPTSGLGDSLEVINAPSGAAVFNYLDASSGDIVVPGAGTISYTGLEPIAYTSAGGTLAFNFPAVANDVTVTTSGANIVLTTSTFENTTVSLAGITDISFNGNVATDKVTIGSPLIGLNVNLNVEEVTLDADIGGTVTGTAAVVNVTANGVVQDGVDVAASGATINVGAGTFVENVTISQPVTLLGTGLTSIIEPTGGSAIELTASAALDVVTIDGFLISGAGGGVRGIYADDIGSALVGSLVVGNVTVQDFSTHGIAVFGTSLGAPTTPSNLTVSVSSSTVQGNGVGAGGDGDLIFWSGGDVTLDTVMVNGTSSPAAENGIQFRSDTGSIGNVILTDVTVTGSYEKTPLAVYNYDDVAGLVATGVVVTADSVVFNRSVAIEGIGSGDVELSGMDLTGAPDPALIAMGTSGTTGPNVLTGGDEDTVFFGADGDDTINGGDGDDTSFYPFSPRADYTISQTTDAKGRVTAFTSIDDNVGTGLDDGTDTLSSIEILSFSDVVLDLNQNVQQFNVGNELIGTFDTIQEAIVASSPGETIRVFSDIYIEDVTIPNNSDITLELEGTVQGDFSGLDDGSTVKAIGNLVIGEGGSFAGFAHIGTLLTEANKVTLKDANTASLGEQTTVATGGELEADNAVRLSGSDVLTGSGLVDGDVQLYNGTVTGNLTVEGQLNGAIGGTGSSAQGVVSAGNSPGVMNVGDLSLTSGDTFVVEVDGTAGAGVAGGHDLTNVAASFGGGGVVSLGSATLDPTQSVAGPLPSDGVYTIIDNDGVDAVTGEFDGLPEGATIALGGQTLVITYVGGDGNDVMLFTAGMAEIEFANGGEPDDSSAEGEGGTGGTTPTILVNGDLTGIPAAYRTVTFSLTPGSATPGFADDFTLDASFTIPAGDYSTTTGFDLTEYDSAGLQSGDVGFTDPVLEINQDTLIEGIEDFSFDFDGIGIALTNGPTTDLDGDASSRNGTTHNIVDDDFVRVTIQDATVTEGTTVMGTVLVETSSDNGVWDNSATIAPGSTISFSISDAGTGDAVNPDDFTYVTTSFTLDDTSVFTPSGLMLAFTMPTVDDAVVEGTETVDLVVDNISSTAGLSTSNPLNSQVVTDDGVITIEDNDVAVWNLTQATSPVVEGGSVAYTFSLTASGSGTGPFLFQAGETASVEVQVTDITTVYGVDYDNAVTAIQNAVTAWNAANPTAGSLAATFAGGAAPVVLTYLAGSDGVGGGADTAMTPDLIVNVTATDDSLVEGSETVDITIDNPGSTTGADVRLAGDDGTGTVVPDITVTTEITDNDLAEWNLTQATSPVVEGGSVAYTFSLTASGSGTGPFLFQAGETASVEVQVTDITTVYGVDYDNAVTAIQNAVTAWNAANPTAGSLAATFAGGAAPVVLTYLAGSDGVGGGADTAMTPDLIVNVTATDDSLVEGSETVDITIDNPGSTTGADVRLAGDDGTGTVVPDITVTTEITDNDSANWTLTETTTGLIDEGDAAVYELTLNGSASGMPSAAAVQSGDNASITMALGLLGPTSLNDFDEFTDADILGAQLLDETSPLAMAIQDAVDAYNLAAGTSPMDPDSFDFDAGAGEVTFYGDSVQTAPTLTIDLNTFEDDGFEQGAGALKHLSNFVEPNEDFTVSISDPQFNGVSATPEITATGPNTVMTTIVDNDTTEVSIMKLNDAQEGNDGDLTNEAIIDGRFKISLSNPSQNTITVTLTDGLGSLIINNGTASNNGVPTPGGDDYANSSLSDVTFSPGSVLEIASVDVKDDMVVEGTETVIATVTSITDVTGTLNPGAISISSTDEASLDIIDDDSAVLTVVDMTEDEETGMITFTVELDKDVQDGFSVDYSVTDVSTEAADFTGALTGTLNFAGTAGETETFTIGINDDMIVEGDETFTVNLGNVVPVSVSPASLIDATDTATGTITNTDTADLTVTDVTEDEENGTMTFTVTLDNPVEGGFDVDWSTANVSTENADFDPSGLPSGTITFAGTAGETQAITINIEDDMIVEGDETFTLSLSNVDTSLSTSGGTPGTPPADNADIDATDTATGTITNTDTADLTVGDVSVNEDLGTVEVTVTLDNPVEGGFNVDYVLTDGSAVSPGDYISTGGTLSFAGGMGETQTITIPIGIDMLVEANETFTVSLTNVDTSVGTGTPNPDNADISVTDTGTVTILNDDTANVTIDDILVQEGDSGTSVATFTVSIDKLSDQDITVDWMTMDDTAMAGSDYVAGSGTVTIPAGQLTAEIDVTINGDTDVEPDEDFKVVLSNPTYALDPGDSNPLTGGPNADAGPGAAQVEITDDVGIGTINNDDALIEFEVDESIKSEDGTGGPGPILLVRGDLTDTIAADRTITLQIVGGTAIRNVDYIFGDSASGPITFYVPDGDYSAGMGFDLTLYDLNGELVSVSGLDPVLNVINDAILEGDESLTIDINGEGNVFEVGDADGINGTNKDTDHVIGDNETATVSVIPMQTVTEESGAQTFDVVLNTFGDGPGGTATLATGMITPFGIQSPISITADVVDDGDGTATPGATSPGDFDYSTQSITFNPGDGDGETRTLTITPTSDVVVEADETVDVDFDNTEAGFGGFADSQVTYVAGDVTILDDDSATVSISGTTDADETGSVPGQFTVTQTAVSSTDTDLTYSVTVGSTASDGGVDYTTLSGTVTILAGSTTAVIDVTGIVDDGIVEADEIVEVMLTGITAGDPQITIDTGNDTDSIAILDNDSATVTLTEVGPDPIAEPSGVASYTLALNGATSSSTPTVVDFSTAGVALRVAGAAPHQTQDYSIWIDDGFGNYSEVTGDSFTIPAGVSSVDVQIRVEDDLVVELTEDVVLTLDGSAGDPVAMGDPSITLGSTLGGSTDITDNDTAQIIIKVLDGTASETALGDPAEIGQFTVRLVVPGSVTSSNPLGTPAPVSYNITVGFEAFGGTAVNGVDYDSLPTTVFFAPGVTDNTINITPEFDLDVEGPESVIVTLDETSESTTAFSGIPFDVQVSDTGDCDSATIIIADDDVAPAVDGIYVNNSLPASGGVASGQWDAEFRDQVDGSDDGSTFGYELTGRADQLETIPWINVDELVVTFDSSIDIASLDLGDFVVSPSIGDGGNSIPGQKIIGGSPVDGVIPTITGFTLEGSNAVRLALSSVLDPAIIELNVNASGITFDGGARTGTDLAYTFRALPGDVVESGALRVQTADLLDLVTSGRINASIGSPNYSFRANVDGNFRIQTADILAINERLNDVLVPPAAPSMASFIGSPETMPQETDKTASKRSAQMLVESISKMLLSGAQSTSSDAVVTASTERDSAIVQKKVTAVDEVFADRDTTSSMLEDFDWIR
ncbi:beta strand repeat-containing protein [Mariniblastus fucicola]|uniref:beta strand repeat-containing protein n=1 Tax=Mariniblastus fucicola TaxID=980251 RepID=UPI0009465694|nr:Calx-beta domain-containing protein [Mariniblastus fucicola]